MIVDWVDAVSATIPTPLVWLLGCVFAFLESGLGLGFLVPGETVVLLLSALLDSWPTLIGMFVAVTAGASAGDHVGYLIGRRSGLRLRETKLVGRIGVDNWDRAVAILERRGAAAVFLTRLLPVVRTLAPAAAGVAGLRYRAFLVASLAGAALWACVYVGIGFFVRGSLDAVQSALGDIGLYAVLGLLAVAAAAVGLRALISRRRSQSLPVDEQRLEPTQPTSAGRRRIQRLADRITRGEEWRTIPNYITFARIALLPCLIVLLAHQQFTASIAVATIVFVSDWADGFIARRTGTVSALGAWLDPVADRLAVIVVAVGFALGQAVPWEYVGLLLIPDVLLGVTAAVAFQGTPDLAVTWVGKIRTGLIFAGFGSLLLGMALAEHGVVNAGSFVGWGFLTAIVGLIGHYIAAIEYARSMFHRWSGQRDGSVTAS